MYMLRLIPMIGLLFATGCSLNNPLPIDDAKLSAARAAIADAKAADAEYCAPALQAKAVANLYWASHEITEEEYHPDENARLINNAIKYAKQAKAKAEEHCIPLKGVHFEVDSAELTSDSTAILDQAVQTLKLKSYLKVEVAAHTDSTASDEYNMELSERRAKSVYDYLIAHGINASRLTAKGYGESQPVADNATEEGRAQNRRVELRTQN